MRSAQRKYVVACDEKVYLLNDLTLLLGSERNREIAISCPDCFGAYVRGGYIELDITYEDWAHICSVSVAFNDVQTKSIALANGAPNVPRTSALPTSPNL